MAPEVLLTNGKGEYTSKVDIWSLGVVLFTCLSGTLPFADDYGSPAAEQIKSGQFQFRSSNWKSVSGVAKSLIKELLTTNVYKRPTIDELLKHRWFKDTPVIEMAHTVMKIPQPERTIVSTNTVKTDDTSGVFLRPYVVNVENGNVQSAKRRRIC